MRARVLRTAEGFQDFAEEHLVPVPLQRPTLNVLTAAEGRQLSRPTEQRAMQGILTNIVKQILEICPGINDMSLIRSSTTHFALALA